ncbi:hypothetical protein Tco_0530117 [Tanacetum coccineum]
MLGVLGRDTSNGRAIVTYARVVLGGGDTAVIVDAIMGQIGAGYYEVAPQQSGSSEGVVFLGVLSDWFQSMALRIGTDNEEKDEKQSQDDKTGLGMEKTVKDKAKSKPKSQEVNPSQLRGQSQENISLEIEIVDP